MRVRFVAAACLWCLVTCALADSAAAHGGRFIPPPTPIGPPPPPSIPYIPQGTPPPTFRPGPGVPGPITPPAVGPGTFPTTGGTTPFARPGGRRPSAAVSDPNAVWETWWNLNRMAYLPDRDEVQRARVLTPRESDDPLFFSRKRADAAAAHVVPFLLELAASEADTRDDVRASALLALGRAGRGPEAFVVLRSALEDARAAQIVRESAALGLGLLRRSDPERRLDGARLDDVRELLLATAADEDVPTRTRAFAVLSVGLLGDQPFGDSWTKDGRLVVKTLWERLGEKHAQWDVPIALLTALGMQPAQGVPDGVREGLERLVVGKRVHGRSWDPIERGHALAALLRLGGPRRQALLLRVLRRPRESRELRRAAYLTLGSIASTLDAAEREEVARALLDARRRDRDPLSRGLADLAAAHLADADLAAGSTTVLVAAGVGRHLHAEARSGPTPSRGFSALALGLAARNALTDERAVQAFRRDACALLVEVLGAERGAARMRGAFVVGAGLAQADAAEAPLLALVADAGEDDALRGHAAVALGWIAERSPELERTLGTALLETRDPTLRREAALALALLGGRSATSVLLRELSEGRTETLLAQVVVALGRIGDLAAVHPLKAFATDADRPELSRSLAVVALGLLVDPEPRPSLLALTRGAFYPARTDALDEAFTIL